MHLLKTGPARYIFGPARFLTPNSRPGPFGPCHRAARPVQTSDSADFMRNLVGYN